MASIRWDRNQTRLLSSLSTVSHATVTPSAVSRSHHCAARVLLPNPVGPWITVSFRSRPARNLLDQPVPPNQGTGRRGRVKSGGRGRWGAATVPGTGAAATRWRAPETLRPSGAGTGTGMSSTGMPCRRCTSRSSSPNSAAVAGRSPGSRDMACSITAHTSTGRPRIAQVRHRMLDNPKELDDHLLTLSALVDRMPGTGAEQGRGRGCTRPRSPPVDGPAAPRGRCRRGTR